MTDDQIDALVRDRDRLRAEVERLTKDFSGKIDKLSKEASAAKQRIAELEAENARLKTARLKTALNDCYTASPSDPLSLRPE